MESICALTQVVTKAIILLTSENSLHIESSVILVCVPVKTQT